MPLEMPDDKLKKTGEWFNKEISGIKKEKKPFEKSELEYKIHNTVGLYNAKHPELFVSYKMTEDGHVTINIIDKKETTSVNERFSTLREAYQWIWAKLNENTR